MIPFLTYSTHINISRRLEEGSAAFKLALKKEVTNYFTQNGRPFSESEFDDGFTTLRNFRFIVSGVRFTYYRC